MTSYQDHGIDIDVVDDVFLVTVSRQFDEGMKRDQWSQQVIDVARGDYRAVMVELGKCPIISSTVIAGLVHLADTFRDRCPDGVILRHCTKHVEKILDMMHLRQLFTLEDILESN